jgi:hypothetical protein
MGLAVVAGARSWNSWNVGDTVQPTAALGPPGMSLLPSRVVGLLLLLLGSPRRFSHPYGGKLLWSLEDDDDPRRGGNAGRAVEIAGGGRGGRRLLLLLLLVLLNVATAAAPIR